jgi:hypothetical protein
MSFRLFIYYCAAWGAAAAFAGWALGRMIPAEGVLKAGVRGLCLGAFVGVGLALVEAVSGGGALRRTIQLVTRAGMAVVVGAAGGWAGGLVGGVLYNWSQVFFIVGWTLTGLLIGAAPATYDVTSAWLRGLDAGGARRKVRNGLLGGSVGGLLGGGVALALVSAGPALFPNRPERDLWTPTAAGFVALGACIGLAVGLAQVILKEAWVRVESGFRPGRQLILSRPEVSIGRAESCDLGLFGDPGVEHLHARILRLRGGFVLVDAGTSGGTYVNDELITAPTPLSSGDQIRIGGNLLSFGERPRRTDR